VQRGGSPTAADRILASRLGAAAVEYLIHGYTDLMIGIQKSEITPIPAQVALSKPKVIDKTLIELARVLSN
jgi:6-phosphofructokinase 1